MHDDLVCDVGLYKGEDTALYLAKGYRVVAIEAAPALAGHCRQCFRQQIAGGRLALVEGAIDEPKCMREGSIRFVKDEQVSVRDTVNPDWRARNDRQCTSSLKIELACIDLAEVMAGHGILHYITIDIEGADRIALARLEWVAQKPLHARPTQSASKRSAQAKTTAPVAATAIATVCSRREPNRSSATPIGSWARAAARKYADVRNPNAAASSENSAISRLASSAFTVRNR